MPIASHKTSQLHSQQLPSLGFGVRQLHERGFVQPVPPTGTDNYDEFRWGWQRRAALVCDQPAIRVHLSQAGPYAWR